MNVIVTDNNFPVWSSPVDTQEEANAFMSKLIKYYHPEAEEEEVGVRVVAVVEDGVDVRRALVQVGDGLARAEADCQTKTQRVRCRPPKGMGTVGGGGRSQLFVPTWIGSWTAAPAPKKSGGPPKKPPPKMLIAGNTPSSSSSSDKP